MSSYVNEKKLANIIKENIIPYQAMWTVSTIALLTVLAQA